MDYETLIGAMPTEAEKQKLLAQLLRNRRSVGELGAISGDKALGPFGQNMVNQADDYATRFQQIRQNDIDDARTKMYYEGQIAMMGRTRDEDTRHNKEMERLKGEENEILRNKSLLPKATEADKARIRAQQKQFASLSEGTAARRGNLLKAQDFLDAFSETGLGPNNSLGLAPGFRAKSGTGRRILHAAGFAPVFTDQGKFEEQFDAFAETAARARLKALGEIRPTDADVKGMKAALFGVGRDENTNKQLLLQYIAEQLDLEEQLEAISTDLGATYIEPELGGEGEEMNSEEDEVARLEREYQEALEAQRQQ